MVQIHRKGRHPTKKTREIGEQNQGVRKENSYTSSQQKGIRKGGEREVRLKDTYKGCDRNGII